MADRKRVYKPLRGTTLWLAIFLYGWLALAAILAASRLFALLAVYAPGSSLGAFAPGHDIDDMLAALKTLLLVGCVIVFCVWIYRATANLHAMGDFEIHSPIWAVAGFLIPVYSLWYGYETMQDIWNNSGPPENNLEGWGWLVPLWWISWVATSAISYLFLRAGTTLAPNDLTVLRFAASMLDLVAGIALLVITAKISRAQKQQESAAAF